MDENEKSLEEIAASEKLMARDKLRYCLPKDIGEIFIEDGEAILNLKQHFEEKEQRMEENELKKRADNVEKIGMNEAQKKIRNKLKKSQFVKLRFKEPDVGRVVAFNFNVLTNDDSIAEKKLCEKLKEYILVALENCNWKLSRKGINIRMGILSGEIHGLESEEDILNHIRSMS